MNNMNFYFKVSGDKLSLTNLKKTGVTGNVNSYRCTFELDGEWDGFYICAAFAGVHETYTKALTGNECVFPAELLEKGGVVRVGLYGTKTDGETVRRIATNFTDLKIAQGCYTKGNTPEEPTADEWEILISKSLPRIGENGNWYFWDISEGEYKDSGFTSRAKDIKRKTVTETTAELEANVFYDFGSVSEDLTITLAEPRDKDVVNEYMFEFTATESFLSVEISPEVKWLEEPLIYSGKKYQCSVLNGVGVMIGVDV